MHRYLWVVMLLGAAVDLLLLTGASILAGYPPDLRKTIPGALLGGLYGGAAASESLYFLGNWYWRLIFLSLVCLVGFGMHKSLLRKSTLYCLLRFALDGISTGLGQGGAWSMGAGAFGLCLICVVGFRDRGSRQYVPVELRHQGRQIHLTALRDTGNGLRDPLTGRSVIVVGPELAYALTGLTPPQLRAPASAIFQLPGGRLIPYKTLDNPGGLLLALSVPDVRIGAWKGRCLVAFAPEQIGNGKFQGLTGGYV